MEATDIETAAEGLLFNPNEPVETETDEATLEEATELDDVEEETGGEDVSEDDAEDVDAEADADDGDSEDEDEGTEESEADEQPQAFSVKVDGEMKEVTLDELTRSYSGQAYIQKGMQENAEARKAIDAQAADLQAAQQKFVGTVQKLQEGGLKQAPQAPDLALLDSDPIGYMQADGKYKAELAQYEAQQREIAEVNQRTQKARDEQHQAYLQQQMQELKTRVPDFADPQKAADLQGKLAKMGVEEYGFSAEEIAAVADARTVQVLVDAMRWREVQSGKAEAKKKPTPPKAIKPTGRRTQSKDVARQKLKAAAIKSGKLEDFANLLFE